MVLIPRGCGRRRTHRARKLRGVDQQEAVREGAVAPRTPVLETGLSSAEEAEYAASAVQHEVRHLRHVVFRWMLGTLITAAGVSLGAAMVMHPDSAPGESTPSWAWRAWQAMWWKRSDGAGEYAATALSVAGLVVTLFLATSLTDSRAPRPAAREARDAARRVAVDSVVRYVYAVGASLCWLCLLPIANAMATGSGKGPVFVHLFSGAASAALCVCLCGLSVVGAETAEYETALGRKRIEAYENALADTYSEPAESTAQALRFALVAPVLMTLPAAAIVGLGYAFGTADDAEWAYPALLVGAPFVLTLSFEGLARDSLIGKIEGAKLWWLSYLAPAAAIFLLALAVAAVWATSPHEGGVRTAVGFVMWLYLFVLPPLLPLWTSRRRSQRRIVSRELRRRRNLGVSDTAGPSTPAR